MNADSETCPAPFLSGHMIDLGAEHSIAIYVRNGVCWVAEFRYGRGEFTCASEWFRFHAGALRYCHNRRAAALKSAMPLTLEMLHRIERLHRQSEAREERMRAVRRSFAAAMQRFLIGVLSRLRGGAAKISQTIG